MTQVVEMDEDSIEVNWCIDAGEAVTEEGEM
jgi:hypothetical protein